MRVRDARQTFLGVWIRTILEGGELTIYGDGSQRRDFTYVDDAVDGFVRAATRPEARGGVFNLGGDRAVSLSEVAELLVAANGGGSFRCTPFPPELEAIDIGDFEADFTRARDVLGWQPRVPLEEGLLRTLAYYREHGDLYWGDE